MKRRIYNENDMRMCFSIQKKSEHASIRGAARAFDVHFTTLCERLVGRTTRRKAHENAQTRPDAEEMSLVKLIMCLEISGFPASSTLIVQMAELVRSDRIVLSMENPEPALPTQRMAEHRLGWFQACHPEMQSIYYSSARNRLLRLS